MSDSIRISSAGSVCASVLLACGILLSMFVSARLEHRAIVDLPLEQFPSHIAGWTGGAGEAMELSSKEKLRLDRYVRRLYSKEGRRAVFLYVGYWRHQTGEYQAAKHSPVLCLPANGWTVARLGESTYTTPVGEAVRVNRVLGSMGGHKSLVYYLFFAGEDFYTQEWQSLLRITLRALLGVRTDGGIIELSMPISDEEKRVLETGGSIPELEEFLVQFLGEYAGFMRQNTIQSAK